MDMVILNPGDYYATRKKEILSTVLGSCISVCLYDRRNAISGMNHFMLVGDLRDEEIFQNPNSRYGIFAMEVLINEILKLGGSKKSMEAKVFGGGHVLDFKKTPNSVPDNNIRFIRAFLELERIPVISHDLGGYSGRKILFFTDDYRVLLRRLRSTVSPAIIAEQEYEARMLRTKAKEFEDRITLFDE